MGVSLGSKLTNQKSFLFFIIGLGAILLFCVVPVDYSWTAYLHEHKIRWLEKFMADSVFEGDMFGGGDIAIIFLLLVGILYFYVWSIKDVLPASETITPIHVRIKEKVIAWKPFLGFVFLSSLTTSVFLVHSFKWVLGRARPKFVFRGELDFSDWFNWGAHFISEGSFRGSFPSGHTATVFATMTIAYMLFWGCKNKKATFWGIFMGVFSFLLSLLMLVSRSMSSAHWISDSLFSIFAGWAIMHLIYFNGLKIPEQHDYFLKNNKHLKLPRYFEFRVAVYLFLFFLGLMAAGIGIRALAQGFPFCYATFILPGVLISWFCGRKMYKTGFFNPRFPSNYQ